MERLITLYEDFDRIEKLPESAYKEIFISFLKKEIEKLEVKLT